MKVNSYAKRKTNFVKEKSILVGGWMLEVVLCLLFKV